MATLPNPCPTPGPGPLGVPAGRPSTITEISDRCPTCQTYGPAVVHRFPSGLTVQVCEQGDCPGARCWTPAAVLAALATGGQR